jgi:hypothetical protein
MCGVELAHVQPTEPKSKFQSPTNRYVSIGVFLVVFGGVVAGVSLLIGVIPILALGLGSLLIGIMTLYLPEPISDLAGRFASDSSVPALLNIENLMEDLSLNEKGVYIPCSGLGVCPKVFVPLKRTPISKRPPTDLNNSRKVFVTLDEKTQEGGLLLEAPGSQLLAVLERSLKIDFSKVQVSDLRGSLESGLKSLEISRTVKLESQADRTVTFELDLTALSDLEAKLGKLAPRLVNQVGAPVSSAVAAAVCKSTGNYVNFRDISFSPNAKSITATLELE